MLDFNKRKTWQRTIIASVIIALILPVPLTIDNWQLVRAQSSTSGQNNLESIGENEEESDDGFDPTSPINALAWGDAINTNLDAVQQALPPPVVKVPGQDIEAARLGKVDTRAEDMIKYLASKHTHLKIDRITKNYSTDRKQFSKETEFSEDDQPTISAHHFGQAFDISEIDTFQCSTKGLFGSKKSPPQPIKVAWQTAEGRAQAGGDATADFDSSSYDGITGSLSKDALMNILADRADFENFKLPGGMGSVNLQDIIKYLGRNEVQTNLGFSPPPGSTDIWGLTYWQGQAAIAQAAGGAVSPSGLVGKDKTELATNFVMSVLENQLKFPDGSLRGKNPDQILENFGKRQLEQQLGLASGLLNSPPANWLPKIRTSVVKYANGQTADLALSLPQGTYDKLSQNPSQAFKILGATKFSDLTKMANSATKDLLKKIDKNQPIQAIPLVGVELPVSISYTDTKALFGDDERAREAVVEKLAADTFASLLNKNRFFGNAYLNLKGQDIQEMITGKKSPGEVVQKIGASVLESSLDLPVDSITKTLAELKKKPATVSPDAWGEDKDGNGFPDAYDNPNYYQDKNGNGQSDIWDTPQAKQNQLTTAGVLLANIGKGSLQELGKSIAGYSDAQAQGVGKDYLKNKITQAVNHELGLSTKINEATLGVLKVTDDDITKMLTGDFTGFKNIEDKIGSVKIGEALQIPSGGLFGYLKGFVGEKDLTVVGALEKLRGVAGLAAPKLDSFGSNADEDRFINQKIQEAIAEGKAQTPDPHDPTNQALVSQLQLQYRLTQQSKSLSDKLQDKAKSLAGDALNRWFEWDSTKVAKYGALSPETILDSLKKLTDNDKNNDDAGKAILKTFVSNTFDAQGDLLPGTLTQLIDNPKKAPQLLLDEASQRLDRLFFGEGPGGNFKAIYQDGRLTFTVDVTGLPKEKQFIIDGLASLTKMVKVSGEPHTDVVKFVNGNTGDAFRGWALATLAKKTNEGNPFGDRYAVSYEELRGAFFPNTDEEVKYVNQKVDEAFNQANLTLTEEQEAGLRSELIEEYRLNIRQNTNTKLMDITLAKTTGLPIQPGFSYAMLYGTTEDRTAAIAKIGLAELGFGNDQAISQKLGFNVPQGTASLIERFLSQKISYAQFQDEIKNIFKDQDYQQLIASTIINDQKLAQITGLDIAPGTSQEIMNWAFGKTDLKTLEQSLKSKYLGQDFLVFQVSKFADKALGLPAGTALQMYQYYQQYQALYGTYTNARALAIKNGVPYDKARADFESGSLTLYVQAFELITGGALTKLTSPLDKALGLPPGTVLNAGLALLANNPYGAAIILLMGILGFGKTKCPDLEQLSRQKVHQVLQEIMDNSPDVARDGALPDESITPRQLISWGKDGQYPEWIKDLVEKANNIYNPNRTFLNPVVERVGFFTGERFWNVIHVGY